MDAAKTEGLTLPAVSNFEAEAGYGVTATVAGEQIAIGARRFMDKLGIDIAPFADKAVALTEKARSPLYMAIDGKVAALLAIADPIKPTTPAAIRAFHAEGLKVVMISGRRDGDN